MKSLSCDVNRVIQIFLVVLYCILLDIVSVETNLYRLLWYFVSLEWEAATRTL